MANTHGKRISGIVNALTVFIKREMALEELYRPAMAFVGSGPDNEVSQLPFAGTEYCGS